MNINKISLLGTTLLGFGVCAVAGMYFSRMARDNYDIPREYVLCAKTAAYAALDNTLQRIALAMGKVQIDGWTPTKQLIQAKAFTLWRIPLTQLEVRVERDSAGIDCTATTI